MKQQIVATVADVERLEGLIRASAKYSTDKIRDLLANPDPLAIFSDLKFTTCGCDPIAAARSLNLVEQINQTFTYWASCSAARWLLEQHPAHAPFLLNLGTEKGHDIQSRDHEVRAEVFAATRPASNRKLAKDVARLAQSTNPFRYVFFLSPVAAREHEVTGVRIVRLPFPIGGVAKA